MKETLLSTQTLSLHHSYFPHTTKNTIKMKVILVFHSYLCDKISLKIPG